MLLLTAHRSATQFSCTTFKSGASYLDADFNITCYDAQHWRYLGAAVVWLFVVPIGVPAFFLWLLRRFKVPQMAKLVNDSAWLREAVQLAWQLDMTQPPMCVGKLNVDNIGDAHLEGLYALFVRSAPLATASNIVTGALPPLQEEEEAAAPVPTGAVAKALASLRAAVAAVTAALERIKFAAYMLVNPDAAGAVGETPEAQRRAFVLKALLTWCQTSGKLALPMMAWEEMVEEEEEEEPQAKEAAKPRISTTTRGTHLKYADLPRLQARAMSEVGFLFAAYHTGTWYWCVQCALLCRCAWRSHDAADAAAQGGDRADAQAGADLHLGPHRARQRRPGCERARMLPRVPCGLALSYVSAVEYARRLMLPPFSASRRRAAARVLRAAGGHDAVRDHALHG